MLYFSCLNLKLYFRNITDYDTGKMFRRFVKNNGFYTLRAKILEVLTTFIIWIFIFSFYILNLWKPNILKKVKDLGGR